MPRVFYDQRWCVQNGIGRFATELKSRLENEHALDLRDVELSHPPTHPLDSIRLSRYLFCNKASLFISPGFNVPIWSRCPVVATVHDLIHVQFAGEQTLAKSLYYRFLQRPVIRRSPVTLTVSDFSRQQIVDWYGLAESKVVSVRNGISDAFKPDGPAHITESPYFVYVGNTKSHKNLPALLDAIQSVAKTTNANLLMVVKSDQWLQTQLQERGLTERVEVVSGVDDEKLASFYRGAVATILPSYFEGFGLPLVEAMACGCPVVGANVTSIPEVIGDAGLLFSPDDSAELAEIILGLLKDDQHCQALSCRGLRRAQDFSWDQVASLAYAAISPLLDEASRSPATRRNRWPRKVQAKPSPAIPSRRVSA
ncbi:Glycogen synthase [Rubripirellula obstinata]|uniref:Glycogen synthase n=1 Tax=Rubripirellula obstinata TaxID=406547 RepID=A0A5B1CSL9_9BACT|nr:glycosyltransferase family 1 protein [Rubripirellula obstinata]KAA1262403.1 Glycogen synthase [Rubripirellula obstinata]